MLVHWLHLCAIIQCCSLRCCSCVWVSKQLITFVCVRSPQGPVTSKLFPVSCSWGEFQAVLVTKLLTTRGMSWARSRELFMLRNKDWHLLRSLFGSYCISSAMYNIQNTRFRFNRSISCRLYSKITSQEMFMMGENCLEILQAQRQNTKDSSITHWSMTVHKQQSQTTSYWYSYM